MRGAVWVASYVVLCLTVLSLAIGMLLLYRRVQAGTLDLSGKIGRWPSPLFKPGDVPPALRRNLDAGGLSGRLIVVVSPQTDDLLFAAVSAARDIARRYGLRCVLVTTGGRLATTRVLPPTFETVPVFSLDDGDFERLGLVATPATILWDDGVVDAAVGFLSPQQVERRFADFLRPQGSLMAATGSKTRAYAPSSSGRPGIALMPSNDSHSVRRSHAALSELLSDQGNDRPSGTPVDADSATPPAS